MTKFKDLSMAILAGLLALSLLTFLSQNLFTNKEAKQVEYLVCLATSADISGSVDNLDSAKETCKEHRP
jgi:hypothetical protein